MSPDVIALKVSPRTFSPITKRMFGVVVVLLYRRSLQSRLRLITCRFALIYLKMTVSTMRGDCGLSNSVYDRMWEIRRTACRVQPRAITSLPHPTP